MKWVLIMQLVAATSGASIHSVPFVSQAYCEAAKKEFLSTSHRELNRYWSIAAQCSEGVSTSAPGG